MDPTKTIQRLIRIYAAVELEVAADAADEDIFDIIGFFISPQDTSMASDREPLRFAIKHIVPQELCVESLEEAEFWKKLPHYYEDLPGYTDLNDSDGKYIAEFTNQFSTDVTREFNAILREYHAAPIEKRIAMNWLFARLCGYSLPSLIKKAHGHEPGEDDDQTTAKVKQ